MGSLLAIPGKIKAFIVLLAGAVLAVAAAYVGGRRDGSQKAKGKAARDALAGVVKGSKGAAKAREAQREGRSPEDGVRSRDGDWR